MSISSFSAQSVSPGAGAAYLFRHSRELLCVADRDGGILQVNPAAAEVLCRTADRLPEEPWFQLADPAGQAGARARFAEALAAGELCTVTTRAQGQPLVEWELNADTDQGLVYILGHDVTAQHQTEDRLQLFEALVDQAAVGMGITDLQGTLTYANQAMREAYGYGEATVGMGIPMLLAPEELADFGKNMATIFATGKMAIEATFQCRDGRLRPAAVATILLRDSAGAPLAIAAVVRDLTEERAREQEVRLAKFALDRSPDNIHWIDPSSKVVYVNDGACAMLGYGRDDLLGMTVSDLDPVFPLQNWALVWGRLKAEGVMSFETVHRRKDGGMVPVDIVTTFLEFEGHEYACVVARDISERRRIETERVAMQEQMIAAQQAALRELSTPLIPIADGVVVMPLIGSLDSNRAQQVIETLLEGVAARNTRVAILDITGVAVVDTQVANALLRAAQAVRLLGAQVVLTGIKPEVAQTLVNLGADLSGLTTRGGLQSGIAYALQHV